MRSGALMKQQVNHNNYWCELSCFSDTIIIS